MAKVSKGPEDSNRELDELRAQIDAADDKILALLNQRAGLVGRVAELKSALAVPFYVPSRERQIADRLSASNPGPFPTDAIRSVFQEIFSACLTLEKKVRFKTAPRRSIPAVGASEMIVRSRAERANEAPERSLRKTVSMTMGVSSKRAPSARLSVMLVSWILAPTNEAPDRSHLWKAVW